MMTLIYWWSLFKKMFEYQNNEIIEASLEYTISKKRAITRNFFWKNEMKYWSKYSDNYWVDVKKYYTPFLFYNLIKKSPKNVSEFILRIKYYYNGKFYKYITRNMTYEWPPNKATMSFTLPIQGAYILDKEGNKVQDVSNKIKKYAGPKHNFHNQKIKVSDIFDYEFDKLEIVDLARTSKVYYFNDFICT